MEINFKKVHTGKDLAISTIVLLAGIGLFFINKGLGITIAVCGLAMFLLYKGGYKKDGKCIVRNIGHIAVRFTDGTASAGTASGRTDIFGKRQKKTACGSGKCSHSVKRIGRKI